MTKSVQKIYTNRFTNVGRKCGLCGSTYDDQRQPGVLRSLFDWMDVARQ